jgi:hypothetical protein
VTREPSLTLALTERLEDKITRSNTDSLELITTLESDDNAPEVRRPELTDSPLPSLAAALREREEPRAVEVTTDKLKTEPSCVRPVTDRPLPRRAAPLRLSEEPRVI